MKIIETGQEKPKNKPLAQGRPCLCCNHPRRIEVDAALIAGERPFDISRKFELSYQSLYRHRRDHVPTQAVAAAARQALAAETEEGASLFDEARGLLLKAKELLLAAEKDGDIQTALRGVATANQCLITMSKLTGAIDDSVHLNILVSPALIELQTAIMEALSPYAEAKAAVVRRLAHLSDAPRLAIEG